MTLPAALWLPSQTPFLPSLRSPGKPPFTNALHHVIGHHFYAVLLHQSRPCVRLHTTRSSMLSGIRLVYININGCRQPRSARLCWRWCMHRLCGNVVLLLQSCRCAQWRRCCRRAARLRQPRDSRQRALQCWGFGQGLQELCKLVTASDACRLTGAGTVLIIIN